MDDARYDSWGDLPGDRNIGEHSRTLERKKMKPMMDNLDENF